MTDENSGSHTRGLKDLFSPWLDTVSVDEAQFFENAVIALDTNVLLELYRISATTRDQLLEALSSVKEQLWIPRQVAWEYAKRRKSCVRDGNKNASQAKEYIGARARQVETSINEVLEKIEEFRGHHKAVGEWDPTSEDVNLEEIRQSLGKLWKESKREVDRAKSEIEQSSEDPNEDKILDRLDELLRGRIGEPYGASELERHVEHAINFRFPNRIPPGFRDDGKDSDLGKAGDYIAWRQLLDYMIRRDSSQQKFVIFVTNDFKQDWWEAGKDDNSWRAHPELILEMRNEAGAELLILSSSDFLEGVSEHLGHAIPQDAVDELKDAEKREVTFVTDILNDPHYQGRLKVDLPPEFVERVNRQMKVDLPPGFMEDIRRQMKVDLPPGFMENVRRQMKVDLPPHMLAGMQERIRNTISPEVEETMDSILKNEGLRKAVHDAQEQMAQKASDEEDFDEENESDERD